MPKRPPKKWMRKCVKKVGRSRTAVDPGAVCGNNWYHQMSPEAKREALRADEPHAGEAPLPNPFPPEHDDFEPAIRAYLQRHDLGRYVQARPHEDGSWHVYYRDHAGRLQRVTISDDEVHTHTGAGVAECPSCSSSPESLLPIAAGESPRAAGERVAVLYEPGAKSAREIDVEVLQKAAIKHTEAYWKKKADEAFRAAARNMNLLAKAEARGDFERALKYKAAAAGDEELMEQYLRQAETVRKVKTHGKAAITGTTDVEFDRDFERVFGRPPTAAETTRARERAENPSPRQATAGGRETKRPKGEEGGGKTVSRWIHWTLVDAGRAYIGKGQVTGNLYRVQIMRGRRRPQWMLLQNKAGLGTPFIDYEKAMLFADKIEADAADIPYGAMPAREAPTATTAVAAAELPASSPPLVTLKRNFKQYQECTKGTGIVEGPKGVWELLGKRLNEEPQEVFVVVPLNIHDRLSDCPIEVARGARSRVDVDPAIVMQAVLGANADSFLVVHNHPGSRSGPSEADITLTHTIEKAAKAVGTLEFTEHFIVSAKGVYAIKGNRMWRPR
jgi:hypothetical protein